MAKHEKKHGKKEHEIGIPKGAPERVKKMDEALDKKHGTKEGSPKDLKMDKALITKYGKKGK